MNQPPKNLPDINYRFAKAHHVLMGDVADNKLTIYYCDDTPLHALNEVRRFVACPVTLVLISDVEFQTRIAEYYQAKPGSTEQLAADIGDDVDVRDIMSSLPKVEDLLETQDDAPIIRLINALFTQAIKQGASDIHVETFEQRVVMRFRIDGMLHEIISLPRQLAPMLISRLKVMAKLDIAEKRVPQDGRISLRIAGHTVDVRVSTIPASHAERVVLRILDKQSAQLALPSLGMPSATLERLRLTIYQPHGILLITGPTGSGKTTSLYAMLTELNEKSRNILTVEDPIEYDLPGVGQMQVNTKVEMSFAKGLRAILRQDPDIVMVGEIRDLETAEIAVQASLTGHFVFSTLHTNTALGAVARLHDMGVEPFLLSSSLAGLLAQRLVRCLCPKCKTPRTIEKSEQLYFDREQNLNTPIYEPAGCEHCNHTGFIGRTGIYEFISVDKQLRGMIHNNEGEIAMERYVRHHTPSIRDDGIDRVLQGITCLSEVLRVTSEEH